MSLYYKEHEALYVNLDDIQNTAQFSMTEIAEEFVLNGGKLLCFDEIHKYNSWSAELKNIYDRFGELKIIATGSSALQINQGSHDLSRRAIVYTMVGMSFREFLELHYGFEFSPYRLQDVLEKHVELATEIKNRLNKKSIRLSLCLKIISNTVIILTIYQCPIQRFSYKHFNRISMSPLRVTYSMSIQNSMALVLKKSKPYFLLLSKAYRLNPI